jgi:hypothetical protein
MLVTRWVDAFIFKRPAPERRLISALIVAITPEDRAVLDDAISRDPAASYVIIE